MCFTTADRPDETSNSNFDISEISTTSPGILPVILKNLVEVRCFQTLFSMSEIQTRYDVLGYDVLFSGH